MKVENEHDARVEERKIRNCCPRPPPALSHRPPKVVGSGRWADSCLLTAAVVPELIFARLCQRAPLG